MRKNFKFQKIIFLFLLLFFMRAPSLFEPYWYGDEGVTLTVGETLRKGAVLYKDIVDNKPPFLYFLASIVGNLSNFKALTLLWSLASLYFFLQLGKKLILERRLFLAGLFFVFLIGTPFLEANIVNGEIYMLLPTLISIYLFFQGRYFLSGLFASFAFLFKVPALFDFLAVFTLFFLSKRESRKEKYAAFLRMLFAFFLPIFLLSVSFFLLGVFSYFFREVFFNNLFYTTSWQILSFSPGPWLLVKTALLTSFIFYLKKHLEKISYEKLFICLWFAFSLFGATLSNRPYLHYLLQLAAPSVFLLVGFWDEKRNKKEIFALLFVLAFFLTFQFRAVWTAPFYVFSYYRNFSNPFFFDPAVKTTYKLSSFLKSNTSENEKVFIFSDNTLIYALSGRRPATRFIAAYHIFEDKRRKREVIKSLLQNPPRIIIFTKPITYSFPRLAKLLKNHYYLKDKKEKYLIYEIKR